LAPVANAYSPIPPLPHHLINACILSIGYWKYFRTSLEIKMPGIRDWIGDPLYFVSSYLGKLNYLVAITSNAYLYYNCLHKLCSVTIM